MTALKTSQRRFTYAKHATTTELTINILVAIAARMPTATAAINMRLMLPQQQQQLQREQQLQEKLSRGGDKSFDLRHMPEKKMRSEFVA